MTLIDNIIGDYNRLRIIDVFYKYQTILCAKDIVHETKLNRVTIIKYLKQLEKDKVIYHTGTGLYRMKYYALSHKVDLYLNMARGDTIFQKAYGCKV